MKEKPYIICHMMMSIDGRIDCAMTSKIEGGDIYYETLNNLKVDASLSGRVTAELEISGGKYFVKDNTPINKEEIYFDHKVNQYDVIIDSKGSLKWNDEDNLIIIMCEQASIEYLNYLKNKHINYIVTGKDKIDLNRASEILFNTFNIKRMAIVGGGHINGGFLDKNLIDEISIVIGPAIDGRVNQISLFDGLNINKEPNNLVLFNHKIYDNGVIYLQYKIN